MNGNYLLNVGPTELGEILPVHARRLRQMGEWLTRFGESVYGTRAGLISVQDGVSTRRGDVHYVHALQYHADRVYFDHLPENSTRATLLDDGSNLPIGNQRGRCYVTIPGEKRDEIDTVIKIE
jgi:alpha-L-fucosidase